MAEPCIPHFIKQSDSLGPKLSLRAFMDYLGGRECEQTWQKAKECFGKCFLIPAFAFLPPPLLLALALQAIYRMMGLGSKIGNKFLRDEGLAFFEFHSNWLV